MMMIMMMIMIMMIMMMVVVFSPPLRGGCGGGLVGGHYSLYPTAVTQLFGPKHAAENLGITYTAFGVLGLIRFESSLRKIQFLTFNFGSCERLFVIKDQRFNSNLKFKFSEFTWEQFEEK